MRKWLVSIVCIALFTSIISVKAEHIILSDNMDIVVGETIEIDGLENNLFVEYRNPQLALKSYERLHDRFLKTIQKAAKLPDFDEKSLSLYREEIILYCGSHYECLDELDSINVFIDIYENTEKT